MKQVETNNTPRLMAKLVVIALLVLLVVPLLVAFVPIVMAAAPRVGGLDNTHIDQDLHYFEQQGNFNRDDFGGHTEASLIMFLEFGWAQSADTRNMLFDLYVYIHNPGGRTLRPNGRNTHTVRMATFNDVNGEPAGYYDFDLHFLSGSSRESGFGENVFLKFRVLDPDQMHLRRHAGISGNDWRRYDISGFMLHFAGVNNPTAFEVGYVFEFAGYAEGMGPADSPLRAQRSPLEFLRLEVEHTYFRTGPIASRADWEQRVNLSSVWFSVPADRMHTFGDNLIAMTAQWYEFRTSPIVVTARQSMHDFMMRNLATTTFTGDQYFVWWDFSLRGIGISTPVFGWNGRSFFGLPDPNTRVPILAYSFFTQDRFIAPQTIIDWINNYSTLFPHAGPSRGTVAVGGRRLPNDLFARDVDPGRIRGHQIHHIRAEDNVSLVVDGNRTTFWGSVRPVGEIADIQLIVEVTQSDLDRFSNTELGRHFFVNEHDVPDFRASAQARFDRGERVFLTRFATTLHDSFIAATRRAWGGLGFYEDAFVSELTAFLDFNIIDLTFERDGTERVIPVVHDPIDIIAGLSPPTGWRPPGPDSCPWWHRIAGWILLAALGFITAVAIFKLVPKAIDSEWKKFFSGFTVLAVIWIAVIIMGLLNVGGLCGMWDVVLFWRQM